MSMNTPYKGSCLCGAITFEIDAAERQADEWHLREISLISTTTARPFYLASGCKQYNDTVLYIGMTGYPLK